MDFYEMSIQFKYLYNSHDICDLLRLKGLELLKS